MLRKITALLLAISLLAGVTACTMPENIFADNAFENSEDQQEGEQADIYNFSISLEDHALNLPVEYSDFSELGWMFSEDSGDSDTAGGGEVPAVYSEDTVLQPGEYSDFIPMSNGSVLTGVKFSNPSKKEASISKCKVVGIKVGSESGSVPKIKICGTDLTLGSSYQSIIDLCGNPSYVRSILKSDGSLVSANQLKIMETEEDTVSCMAYVLSEHSYYEFDVDGSVVGITIENDTEPEEPYDYKKEKKYKSESLSLYNYPNLLGKTFSDFAFKYDGNLYTLPIPVRELIDDGWTVVRNSRDKVPPGTTADGFIIRKGNTSISLILHNYDLKNACTPINCYAVCLDASMTGPYVNLLMPKAITLGSDEKDLIAAFGKTYEKAHPTDYEENADSQTVTATEPSEPERFDIPEEENCYVEKTVGEEYTVYSFVMPDEVPSVTLPVSLTDIGDTGAELLGSIRKHIDVYVRNDCHKVWRVFMQNCPEYKVDEAKIIEQQMEEARKKEQEAANQ